MTQEAFAAQHICNFYLLVNFCDLDLTLTFFSMPFVIMRLSFVEINSCTLVECELFAVRLIGWRAQKE